MKGRILLVEDDETFRSFVQTILEDEEYEVRIARDGREGEQLLAKENFDLVITDLKMPGKSGLDLFVKPGRTPEHLHLFFLPPLELLTKQFPR